MIFSFELVSSTSLICEKYESAFRCAVESVESLLSEYEVEIESSIPKIFISPRDPSSISLGHNEISSIVKGAFIDADGFIYPEFSKVRREIFK